MENKKIIKENGLEIEVLETKNGEIIKSEDVILIEYSGFLEDGTKFDSSKDRNEPLEVQIGIGYVIDGWDKGIVGLKVGDKAKLFIPSEMAYGEFGIPGVILANSKLIFEVHILEKIS